MANSENLSDKIRKEVNSLQKSEGDKLLGYESVLPELPEQLNPDFHKMAFSTIRKTYENNLDIINDTVTTGEDVETEKKIQTHLININQLADSKETSISLSGIKGFLRKIIRKLIMFALRDDFSKINNYHSELTRLLNIMNI